MKKILYSDLRWWKEQAIPFIRTMRIIAGVSLLLCIVLFVCFPHFYPVWGIIGIIAIYYMVILPLAIRIFFFRGSKHSRELIKFYLEWF